MLNSRFDKLLYCLQSGVFFTACVLFAGAAYGQSAVLGPVTLDYFGLNMYRANGGLPWPDMPFGSWRLWDAYVDWANLEPERGRWDFSKLDRVVAEAEVHMVKPLLVLAHSPAWASARPREAGAYKPGLSAEPADMADWRNYVRVVATRYRGKINEYQVWNEPSDRSHYSGSVEKLIEMTCEAHQVLKSIDPNITVVSGGSAGGGGDIKYLDRFLASGGAQCIDVVAHHFYVPRQGPEAMVPLIREVRAVMRKRGVAALPLWNTETGWWIANTDGLSAEDSSPKGGWRMLDSDLEAGATIARSFLLARAEGVDRFYWYGWANRIWGLADAAGKPKAAVAYWADVANLMLGRTVTACNRSGRDYSCTLKASGGQITTVHWRDESALVMREGPALEPVTGSALPK